jgi:hypothetical protein
MMSTIYKYIVHAMWILGIWKMREIAIKDSHHPAIGMRFFRAQGATEYLVLLAVVLIVALVSVALLGFFPGMAQDSKVAQGRAYWSGASPVAIQEAGARFVYDAVGNYTHTYFRIRNNGNYQISLTKILAGNTSISNVWTGGWAPIATLSGRVLLAPGEEFVFGITYLFAGVPDLGSGNRTYFSFSGSDATSYTANLMNAASSLCSRSAPYGYLTVSNFGFEYTQTIEGQTITKRQVGTAPLIVQCMNNYN